MSYSKHLGKLKNHIPQNTKVSKGKKTAMIICTKHIVSLTYAIMLHFWFRMHIFHDSPPLTFLEK